MLKLENVSKIYYNKGMIATGITKVNLELKLGEFVVITGESGSGKSTLLNVISGIDSYEEGEMYINGKETSHYTEKEFEDYRRKYIANIFQSFNLINSYTVYQNIELVLLLNGSKKRDVKKKILDIIEQVGLTKFKNTKVSKLSGGQKQRVAIARAIIKDTPIIVADEPTGNLDEKASAEIIELLQKVAKDKLVVVVTHNIDQVEQYATRMIKMHDGRMVQNTQIKDIEEPKKINTYEYKNISVKNKYRLGIRNTFNIFSKFILLFCVFLLMSVAFLAEYAGFKLAEYEASQEGYGYAFRDVSDNRVIIKKQNKKAFTSKDYEEIKKLSNIDYLVEDDLFIDTLFNMIRNDMWIYGNFFDVNNLRENIDIGRMPKKANEIVLEINKEHFYITNLLDEVLNKSFNIMNMYGNEAIQNVNIVGIKYTEDDYNYNMKCYVSQDVLKNLRKYINQSYSSLKILLNNQYTNYRVIPNKNVKKGTAIVDNELKYQFKNNQILNKSVKISVSNIYYEQKLNLKIADTYTKYDFNEITGLKKYNNYMYTIFVNPKDYDSLYNKASYQSSVYLKDSKQKQETILELEKLGLMAKPATDYKVNDGGTYKQIIQIIKVVVTIIVIAVLFFISYLIIRVILKSRNVYYTTLRMLGATYKNIRRILNIELFVNSTLSYAVVLSLIYLIKTNIIQFEFVRKLVEYVTVTEYVVMYIILVVIAKLISRKFAKKLFKNTAVSTYNEEV